jgi:hypothetical protein
VPTRLPIAEGIYQAKQELKGKGIESPSSPDIIRRFINRVKKERADIWIPFREGSKAADDKVFPYMERDWSALEVGDVIVGDGHQLNFQVVDPYTGKPCRPKVVLFWDWRSSYVLGWELMLEESIQCITSALRNSIICLGKIPKCVYLDNGRAFKAKVFTSDINLTDTEILGLFKRLKIEAHFALPYNARSKPIERIFRIINDQLERLTPTYVGSCIGDKPAWLKPNEKFARSMRSPHIPTIEETNGLFLWWRNRYVGTPTRARDGLRPKDIFDQGKGAGVELRELDYLMMSGEIRRVHRNGITWLGRHWYNEALCGLNDEVLIKYSYSDLSKIYIYYKNEFLCEAEPVQKVHPMVSLSENPKDMEEFNRQQAMIRRLRRDVMKVCREGSPELLRRLPLKEIAYEIPKIDMEIEKVEAEKLSKRISPFCDDFRNSDLPTVQAEESNIDTRKDDVSVLSCPVFKYAYEMYEWFYLEDPKGIKKIIDLTWIDWYEDSYWGKNLKSESDQNQLKFLLSKRRAKLENVPYSGDLQEERTDYRLGCDPVIEAHWREIKNNTVVDPISGLSRLIDQSEFPSERTEYEFYRGIEKRLPGTLTDTDWRRIEEYQTTREWERIFHEMEIYRLYRTVENSPSEDHPDESATNPSFGEER